MTRTEFIRSYAKRSGLSGEWSDIGLIEIGGKTQFALPCACGEDICEGWAMVTPDSALHHLFFCTPEPLRQAYAAIVGEP
jgi:hypothetical protein